MKEQSTRLGLLHVELAHPAEMHKSRLLLGLDNALISLPVVDELPLCIAPQIKTKTDSQVCEVLELCSSV